MNEEHLYSLGCECVSCRNETALQRARWEEARKMCSAHGTSGVPCEICLDVACDVDSEDPMRHALGILLAKVVRQNWSGRAA